MNDARDILDQILVDAPPTDLKTGSLHSRVSRRDRRERVGALVLGLSLFGALLWGMSTIYPSSGTSRPEIEAAAGPPEFSLGDLPVAGPGQFYYEDAEIFLGPSSSEPAGPWRTRNWLAPDGSGRMIADEPAQGGDRYGIAGGTGPHSDVVYAPGESPTEFVSLTADPGGIGPALIARASASPAVPIASPGPGQDDADMRQLRIFDSLLSPGGENLLDPSSQAAVFEVLVQMPGIETSEGSIDPTGRAATTVSFTYVDGIRISWFFTPDTHQVLAVEETGSDGQLYERDVVLEWGIADSRQDQPAASQVLIGSSS